MFLPLFSPPIARVTESFGKWIMVNFQLGYLEKNRIELINK